MQAQQSQLLEGLWPEQVEVSKVKLNMLAETEAGKQLRTNLLGPGLSWTKGPQHSQCKRKRWHSTRNKHNRLEQQQKRTAGADVTRLIHPNTVRKPH